VTATVYPGLAHAWDNNDKKLGQWLVEYGPARQAKAQLTEAQKNEQAGKLGAAYAFTRPSPKTRRPGTWRPRPKRAPRRFRTRPPRNWRLRNNF